MLKTRKVVIVKGNPKFIKNNPHATKFYKEIKEFLESNNCKVVLDPGKPYTKPPNADIWIGHSGGADRLSFAPKHTKTLIFGSSRKGAINHSKDNTKDLFGPNNIIPNKYYYVFTDEMKKAILKLIR